MVVGTCLYQASRSDTVATARRVNTGLYRSVRLGSTAITGVKSVVSVGCIAKGAILKFLASD